MMLEDIQLWLVFLLGAACGCIVACILMELRIAAQRRRALAQIDKLAEQVAAIGESNKALAQRTIEAEALATRAWELAQQAGAMLNLH